MLDWNGLTLYLYVTARMSGMILFNPFLSRTNIPNYYKTGLILLFSALVGAATRQEIAQPQSILELAVHLLLELAIGFFLGLVIQFFLYAVQLAGHAIDTQMGMTMNQIYDASARANLSVTGQIFNILMMLLFFVEGGHFTMIRLMLTSQQIVPFGVGRISEQALQALLLLFSQCTTLGIKLCMPILAAELLGQLAMGILMKVNPQINVFTINIDLKVLIGLILLVVLMAPFSEFILSMEAEMLRGMEQLLRLYA